MLKSWKGDYLHRPDSDQGVTTWDQGTWTVEIAQPRALTRFPIAISARINQRYVTAENGGASSLIANRTQVGPWEGFQVVDLGGGNVAIKSTFNGLYVTAENGGASPLIANRTQVGPWETFRLINLENNDFALRAVNGLYVSALSAGGSPLTAAGPTANTWETFHWTPQI